MHANHVEAVTESLRETMRMLVDRIHHDREVEVPFDAGRLALVLADAFCGADDVSRKLRMDMHRHLVLIAEAHCGS